jgi:hypothetical protein
MQTEFQCPETALWYWSDVASLERQPRGPEVVRITIEPEDACAWCGRKHPRTMLAPR